MIWLLRINLCKIIIAVYNLKGTDNKAVGIFPEPFWQGAILCKIKEKYAGFAPFLQQGKTLKHAL